MQKNNHNKYLNRLLKIFQASFQRAYVYPRQLYDCHQIYFSQEGEDILLNRIFPNKRQGFYVDVGAHHPQHFSNTYLFYLRGWRGINIDAMPGSMEAFNRVRPDDINLEAAISDTEEILTYYMFNESALNGFSEHISISRNQSEDYRIIGKKSIGTKRLSSILDKYLPPNQDIDFLSIDAEGFDYQILLSNDWFKYQPKIILVEELSMDLINNSSNVGTLLKAKGYELFSKTFNTSFYRLATA